MYVNFIQLLSLMRKRKSITRDEFQKISGYSLNLDRVETRALMPKTDSISGFLEVLQIPESDFFRPYANGQPLNSYTLRTKLLRVLEWGNEHKKAHPVAIDLVGKLETMKGFDTGFNRQFLSSAKAQLFLQQGKPPEEILPIIYEGIAISFPEFDLNSFNGEDILAFEEPSLLSSLAKLMALHGNLPGAINLLKNVQAGISKLPVHTKDEVMVPVLQTLAELQLQNGNFADAIETCNLGTKLTQLTQYGKFAPNFIFIKARCLHGLGDITGCRSLLKQAYFGFSLLQKDAQAKQVLAIGKEFGITFDTYGVEHLKFNPPHLTGLQQGEFDKYENIGELIGNLRKYERLSLSELCEGICSTAELSRIENGKTNNASPWILQALMQRLGRNPELYLCTFLSVDDFEDWILDQNMVNLMSNENFGEMDKLIKQVEPKESYQTGIKRQKIQTYKCQVIGNEIQHAKDPDIKKDLLQQYFSTIDEALKITIPSFDERHIANYRLTAGEVILLGNLAKYCFHSGQQSRAFDIFARLRAGISKYYTDKTGKLALSYLAAIYNHSLSLLLMKQPEEALEALEEGLNFAMQHANLVLSWKFLSLKINILYEQGHKEECIPLYALLFFSTIILAEHSPAYVPVIDELQKCVKKNLGVELS